jgi:hypothetical protein
MERREERLEKCRNAIRLRFESGRRAMQTRAPPICLFELVAKNSVTFERAINQVTLRMLQWTGGNELFAVDGEFGVHPIGRQQSACPMDKHETGDLAVDRKNFKRSIRSQPPGKIRRQTKYKMRLRKLKLHSWVAVNPAPLDALHSGFFSTPE